MRYGTSESENQAQTFPQGLVSIRVEIEAEPCTYHAYEHCQDTFAWCVQKFLTMSSAIAIAGAALNLDTYISKIT